MKYIGFILFGIYIIFLILLYKSATSEEIKNLKNK
jgi:hypothetical protein